MPLALYQLSGSPFTWRVDLALRHKGLDFEPRAVDLPGGEHRSAEFLALNPRGKVPVLADGDAVLYESVAILEYLDDRYPQSRPLYPTDAVQRARVRRLICEVDNYWWPMADLIVRNVYFKPEAAWDAEELARGRDGVAAEIARFEDNVQGEGFAGPLGAADYALYPLLAHLARYEKRKPDLGLTSLVGPKLRGLMDAVEGQPFFDASYPPHWR